MEIDLAEILNIEPNLENFLTLTAEPSLGALIYKHYAEHFSPAAAKILSQKYVDALVVQYNETKGE